MMKKVIKRCVIGFLILLLLSVIVIAVYIATYRNPEHKKLEQAGIVEKQADVNGVQYNYAEGPDNGQPLVLLHAQLLDWYTYSKVLPALSEHFHVYAIDYPGHGKTVCPDDFIMNADNIGGSLDTFIREVVGEPVFISGNSSGGLLTTWLAANDPEMIMAAVLEDPPLFSSEYPEIKETIAYRSFTTSEKAVNEGYDNDFLMYWVNNSTAFFENYVGKGAQPAIKAMISYYRLFHRDEELELAFMPASVQEMLRGLDMYDPKFGAAFYEGTWNEGFDHAEALQKIECPVLLIQADTSFMEDGTLNGAMSEKMANKAMSLLQDGQYVRVQAGHVTNLEIPEEYTAILIDFFLNAGMQSNH